MNILSDTGASQTLRYFRVNAGMLLRHKAFHRIVGMARGALRKQKAVVTGAKRPAAT